MSSPLPPAARSARHKELYRTVVRYLSVRSKLKRKGVRQILLSATEIDMLKGQLEALGIESYFDGIFGADNIHASSKKKQAEMWCLENPSAKPLFFGDTNHDFEVAEAVGGDCILFSGGHQSEERLLEIGCPVVRRISDIVSYFS